MTDPNPQNAERKYHLLAVRIFAEFGAAIAAPAVIAAIVGTRLDAARGTGRRWLAFCLLIAFALTAAYLYRRAKAYGKEYEGIGATEKPRP